MRKLYILIAAVTAAALLAGPAHAAPSNDDIANATVITGLPYSDSTDTTEATWTGSEGGCGVSGYTIWYVWTPTEDATVSINVAASTFTPSLTLWHGGYPPAAIPVCGFPFGQLTYRVEAGETYYLQIATLFFWEPGGPVQITIDEVPPPPNDDFADAIAFTSVPFSGNPDLIAATTEPAEPMACGTNFGQSVWYAFTPTTTGSYGGNPGVSAVNVYTGTSLGDLTNVACSQWWGLAFHADAGTTYYLQVHGGGLQIDLLPPPTVEYYFSPGDPSTLDHVSFNQGGYWDPSVTTLDWDFGDGTTAAGASVSHKFAADGDYSVTLTGTTDDGRSNSQTQTVHVQTHDIAIGKFKVPTSANAGQTRQISVEISNRRYPETVAVQVFKSVPGGFHEIGNSTQPVQVLVGGKSTTFVFNYTFTTEDAAIGKVTFKAVATLVGTRDALPADNDAIAPPTRVGR